MPRKRKGPDVAQLEAAASADAYARRAASTSALDKHEIVRAIGPFAAGERIIRPSETFHAGHPIVRAHPSMFEPATVDNPYEER